MSRFFSLLFSFIFILFVWSGFSSVLGTLSEISVDDLDSPDIPSRDPIFSLVPAQTGHAVLNRPELFRVQLENWVSGSITISKDQGKSWTVIGHVLKPNSGELHHIQDYDFTASDWAYVGGVAATAVNAIHIKAGQSPLHAILFSLLPSDFFHRDPIKKSYLDRGSSIVTDLSAGTEIFGGPSSFRVGDCVLLVSSGNTVPMPWPEGVAPHEGDLILMIAQAPLFSDWMLEFENHKDGSILFSRDKSPPECIGKVLKPFTGSGRFSGGIFQSEGKIRANHPGVIDVSTSPFGMEGGIQIVPNFHGCKRNLRYVSYTPVYMMVSPNVDAQPLEGRSPLFSGFIRPGDLVEAKVSGNWGPMPISIGKDFFSFKNVEAIRIRSQ